MAKKLPENDLLPFQISSSQIQFYRENGYLMVEKLFSEEACDILNAILRSYADENFSAIMNLDRENSTLRGFMKSPRIVSIMETLQGAEVVGLMSQMLFKEAGSHYASQAWNPHQDNAYPQNPNGAYFTLNVALADQYLENGCLYIFPGSHKEGLFPCEATVSYREIPGANPGNTVASWVLEKYNRKVDLPMKKGGTLFLHGDVVHGSYPNTTDQSRPLLSMSFITKGESFIPGRSAKRMEIPLH